MLQTVGYSICLTGCRGFNTRARKSSIFPPHTLHNSLRLRITLLILRLSLNLTARVPIPEDSKQRKRHRESPQREAQDHLVLVGPVCSSDSIRNGTTNRLPRSENSRCPRDIAVSLRAFDLRHQPVDISLQDFVEELEAEVDGEGGIEEGSVAEVERWWVGV